MNNIRNTWYDYLAMALVIVGGINWGLVGAFNFNLVEALFGPIPALVTLIYILVGIAAIYMVYYSFTSVHQPRAATRPTGA